MHLYGGALVSSLLTSIFLDGQVLGKEERSLQALLSNYAGLWQDKAHQLDDWRMR